jgi:hypothetical protein
VNEKSFQINNEKYQSNWIVLQYNSSDNQNQAENDDYINIVSKTFLECKMKGYWYPFQSKHAFHLDLA